MKKIKKIYLIIPTVFFGILFSLFYILINDFKLGNNLGTILGFLLAFSGIFFTLFLFELLNKKKENKND